MLIKKEKNETKQNKGNLKKCRFCKTGRNTSRLMKKQARFRRKDDDDSVWKFWPAGWRSSVEAGQEAGCFSGQCRGQAGGRQPSAWAGAQEAREGGNTPGEMLLHKSKGVMISKEEEFIFIR